MDLQSQEIAVEQGVDLPVHEDAEQASVGDPFQDPVLSERDVPLQIPELPGMPINEPGNSELLLEEYFRDHFTLSTPSSLVRFRSAHIAARVFENRTSQFILEEKFDTVSQRRRIYVKQLSDGTTGLQFLRGVYSIMCVFWTGIFFVLCLQVLMVMVLEMTVQIGTTGTNADFNLFRLVGIVLGIFVLSYGFAYGLVIAGAFVLDAWSGHDLVKLFFFRNRYGNVFVDWIFFCFFVLFPVLVMCITLLLRLPNAWSITMLFWYACVSVFFVIFAVNSVYFEVKGALSFLSKRPDMIGKDIWQQIKTCIILTQRATYSGYRTEKYLACSAEVRTGVDQSIQETSILDWSRQQRTGPWSLLTKWSFLSTESQVKWAPRLFTPVDPPEKLYTIEDVQEHRPYVTKHTWNLERLFCRPRNSRYIVIVGGPGALTAGQMKSSLACSFLGIVVFFLLFLSLLIWLEFPAIIVVIAMSICALFSIPMLKDLRRLVYVTRKVFEARNEQEHRDPVPENLNQRPVLTTLTALQSSRRESEISNVPNEGMFLVAQQSRVTKATERLCWIAFFLEILIFVLYPLIALCLVKNLQLVFLFVVVVGVTGIRHYINLVAVVEETGQLSLIGGQTAKARWAKRSRLNDLIESISYNKARYLWQYIFAGCGLLGLLIFIGASQQDSFESKSSGALTFVNGYAWTPQNEDVRYGNCNFTKSTTFGTNATLADFAFLTSLPYKTDSVATTQLHEWFQDTNVTEDNVTVWNFRQEYGYEKSPVFFRLYRFHLENGKDRGVISIRGTQNSWDILADFQLWSAAMLCQGLRVILPIGEMWTPILGEIISMMSFFQKGSVDQISFYKVTTKFANVLKNDTSFDNLQLTGHSLGGGLAIISSAQSGVPSVALSGPNAMLMGRSFEPQVFPDALNKYTFNIVPEHDIVPHFDDLAKNYQNIRCLAEPYDFLSCHDYVRSLCEIVTTCGNGNRPAICECVFEYNYPAPNAMIGNDEGTFEEACKRNGYTKD